jgi:subtilisin family serine protease
MPIRRRRRHHRDRRADVASVEPLEGRTLLAATSDSSYPSQYALKNTNTSAAWDLTRGSATVLAASIDTGVDYTHPDLYSNIWINQSEIPTGVKSKLRDTDGDGRISFYDLNSATNKPLMKDANRNGYIDAGDLLRPVSQGGWEDGINGRNNANDVYTDDIVGWDFAENDNKPFDDGTANEGHGTHTAGILGATGNNSRGISGVIQKVSIMVLRIFKDSGYAVTDPTIAKAIRYAADSGAKVANASWGSNGGYDGDVLYNAIQYAGTKSQTFVTAAGNDGRDLDSNRYDEYPAEYALGNLIVVSADTSSGSLASWSNYGEVASDIAAPGNSVLSTLPGGRYGTMSGTSMATPMVSGTIALMLAKNKTLTPSQVRSRLLAGVDQTKALYDRVASHGELNVNNAVRGLSGTRVTTYSTTSLASVTASTGSNTLSTLRNDLADLLV